MKQNSADSDANSAVNLVYSGMKLLENKYIDLANFYKDLLIQEKTLTTKLLHKISNEKSLTQKIEREQAIKKQETTI